MLTAFNNAFLNIDYQNGIKDLASEGSQEQHPPSSSDQEPTPDKDTPSPVTSDAETKSSSWATSEPPGTRSPRHAKMLYKTRTLSALPLNNIKVKSPYENRLLAALNKQMSLDENYMRSNSDNADETALYFKLLFFGSFCTLIWKHIWLLPVMLFFLAIHVIKRLLDAFGVWLFCENQYNSVMAKVKGWWQDR